MSESAKSVSSYGKRSTEPTKIIAHIGVGGFSRAHQFYVLNQLEGGESSWGVMGVGIKPWDAKMYETLKRQDFLFSCNMRSEAVNEVVVVKSIVDYAPIFSDAASFDKLLEERVKIISLTVTEKGYCTTETGELDLANEDVKADVSNFESSPFQPQTAVGLICRVIEERRKKGVPTLTIMSCDNLPMNGLTTKKAVLSFAKQVGGGLLDFIEASVPFPNSMVDRITPVTSKEHIEEISKRHFINDEWPVVCEPFLQWVIEDKFVDGCRPSWDKVDGVIFTDDVEGYEFMKLRLLNSTHSSMSYISTLAGFKLVFESMADKDVESFVRRYMGEIVATLEPVAGVDFAEYMNTLVERFANPEIKDSLDRLSLDGSQKFRNALAPALVQLKESGGEMKTCRVALAAYLRYCAGVDMEGKAMQCVDDPMKAGLEDVGGRMKASPEKGTCEEFLTLVFGEDLVGGWGAFVDGVFSAYLELEEKGARAMLVA
ncbi:hypothetical protein TrVE_jg11234 [Triparma verrucosa]|uniref:mannitol 2-dehydrogenase n=1 Tax=Triparma verrucosa TaxID=1606542 RepID=A0A9W7FLS4_9STRA|nr:hypothetical protein TrVE_jg11234 [Triparma verrucosa]